MGKNTSYDDDVYARTISDNQADSSHDDIHNADHRGNIHAGAVDMAPVA